MKPYLICPTCGSDDIMKNGTTRRGKQNYKCRDCGRQFVEKDEATATTWINEQLEALGVELT